MAVDWTKERLDANGNLCGYCGSPGISVCDGSCFSRDDYPAEKIKENKRSHISEQLQKIPLEIERLKQREIDFKKELAELQK